MTKRTGRIARLAIVCGISVVFPCLSSAEEAVLVPPGTYTLADIFTREGTAENWIRYQPQKTGTVTIRGGGSVKTPFVILDGFLFDGNLHPRAPQQTGALNVAASNVRIENSELRGPKDIHTGYDVNGQTNCDESYGVPNRGGGMSVDSQNVVFDNVVVHGFYTAGTLRQGSSVVVQNSLFRNNFNGLEFKGTSVEIRDSVMWVHPNHLNTIEAPGGSVRLINNLIVSAQEANLVLCADCVSEFVFVHNTLYEPPGRPCGDMEGIKTALVKDSVTVRDNIVVSLNSAHVGSSMETRAMTSDFNMFYHHKRGTDEFRYGPRSGSPNRVSRSEWLNLGRDNQAIFDTLPAFRDPPEYQDFSANRWGFRIPNSAAEARSWFFLTEGSSGTGAASDKRDIGITVTPVSPPSPRELRINNPR